MDIDRVVVFIANFFKRRSHAMVAIVALNEISEIKKLLIYHSLLRNHEQIHWSMNLHVSNIEISCISYVSIRSVCKYHLINWTSTRNVAPWDIFEQHQGKFEKLVSYKPRSLYLSFYSLFIYLPSLSRQSVV